MALKEKLLSKKNDSRTQGPKELPPFLFPEDHPATAKIYSYRCKHCSKWTSVLNMSKNKAVWHCAWCSKQVFVFDLFLPEEDMVFSVAKCHRILASFYRKKVKTLERKPCSYQPLI